VAAPVVNVEALMPAPQLTVQLPPRVTDTTIVRDTSGRIAQTIQTERDA